MRDSSPITARAEMPADAFFFLIIINLQLQLALSTQAITHIKLTAETHSKPFRNLRYYCLP
jgi:hypothetical protein